MNEVSQQWRPPQRKLNTGTSLFIFPFIHGLFVVLVNDWRICTVIISLLAPFEANNIDVISDAKHLKLDEVPQKLLYSSATNVWWPPPM